MTDGKTTEAQMEALKEVCAGDAEAYGQLRRLLRDSSSQFTEYVLKLLREDHHRVEDVYWHIHDGAPLPPAPYQ